MRKKQRVSKTPRVFATGPADERNTIVMHIVIGAEGLEFITGKVTSDTVATAAMMFLSCSVAKELSRGDGSLHSLHASA